MQNINRQSILKSIFLDEAIAREREHRLLNTHRDHLCPAVEHIWIVLLREDQETC